MAGFLESLLLGTENEAQKKNEASTVSNMAALATQYGFGQSQLFKGLAALNKGYTNAQGILAKQGQTATNQILASKKQTDATNAQSLVSKGLFNTSIQGNLANQSQAMTAQALGGLAEALGTQQANLAVGQANAQQGAYQSLAQFAVNKVAMQANLTPQYQGTPGALGGLAGGFAQAYGTKLGEKL